MRKTFFCVLGMLLLLTGCIELEEKISIEKDGSGYYEAKFALAKEFTSMLQTGLKEATGKSDLPMSEKDLESNFRGEGVRIERSSFEIVEGRLVSAYRIAFQNAPTFFDVPGMRKRFRLYRQGENLVLKSVSQSSMEPGAQQASFPSDTGSNLGGAPTGQGGTPAQGMEEMQAALQGSMKAFLKGFRVSITAELPNEIQDSNATQVGGKIARWVIDENTLANLGKGMPLQDTLWARCSMKGLAFRPSSEEPVRVASTPSPTPSVAAASLDQTRAPSPASQSPDAVTSGGKSIILLKNGNRIKVEGFRREGDMLTLWMYGGTISLPVSSIASIQGM